VSFYSSNRFRIVESMSRVDRLLPKIIGRSSLIESMTHFCRSIRNHEHEGPVHD
jgi:hypothetical protein